MSKVLIFGGTTEGRLLTQKLCAAGHEVTLSCATEYGRELVQEGPKVSVLAQRLDARQMEHLMRQGFEFVCDTTHPYAREVSKNIRQAAAAAALPYLRLLRSEDARGEAFSPEELKRIHEEPDAQAAARWLKKTQGPIFLTTGSKDLPSFSDPELIARIWLRILPMRDSLETALSLGFLQPQIIAMQGPFSQEVNEALFHHARAKFLVTKDSGDVGGYGAKLQAALTSGMEVVVLKRPQEEGYQWQELLAFFHSFSI
ncbi:Cobalt-precorrin-6A reductase [Clostridiaceae bacterium JG1575]|nr:Cobalt-precorrin-6A reductase [Clostridiaceae bacterium JG1575]